MESFFALLAKFGINLVDAVSGALGAFISLQLFKFDHVTGLWGKWSIVVCGCVLANYATHPILAYFKLSGSDYGGLVGLFIGLLGISVVAKLVTAFNEMDLKGLLEDLLRKLFGIGKGGDK